MTSRSTEVIASCRGSSARVYVGVRTRRRRRRRGMEEAAEVEVIGVFIPSALVAFRRPISPSVRFRLDLLHSPPRRQLFPPSPYAFLHVSLSRAASKRAQRGLGEVVTPLNSAVFLFSFTTSIYFLYCLCFPLRLTTLPIFFVLSPYVTFFVLPSVSFTRTSY